MRQASLPDYSSGPGWRRRSVDSMLFGNLFCQHDSSWEYLGNPFAKPDKEGKYVRHPRLVAWKVLQQQTCSRIRQFFATQKRPCCLPFSASSWLRSLRNSTESHHTWRSTNSCGIPNRPRWSKMVLLALVQRLDFQDGLSSGGAGCERVCAKSTLNRQQWYHCEPVVNHHPTRIETVMDYCQQPYSCSLSPVCCLSTSRFHVFSQLVWKEASGNQTLRVYCNWLLCERSMISLWIICSFLRTHYFWDSFASNCYKLLLNSLSPLTHSTVSLNEHYEPLWIILNNVRERERVNSYHCHNSATWYIIHA